VDAIGLQQAAVVIVYVELGVVVVENQADGTRYACYVFIGTLGWVRGCPWGGHEKARRVRDLAGRENWLDCSAYLEINMSGCDYMIC